MFVKDRKVAQNEKQIKLMSKQEENCRMRRRKKFVDGHLPESAQWTMVINATVIVIVVTGG